jgi:hypothetical protein
MNNKMIWSDAWFLLATIYAARESSAPLSEVIAAADYIQHAIFTFEETEGALARLTENGYLVFSAGNLSPSEKTNEFYRSITKSRRKALDEQKDLEKFIGATAWDPKFDLKLSNAGVVFHDLTPQLFDDAVQAYIGKHKKGPKKTKNE